MKNALWFLVGGLFVWLWPAVSYPNAFFAQHDYSYQLRDVLPAEEWVNKGSYWEGYQKEEEAGREEGDKERGRGEEAKEEGERTLVGYAFLTSSLVKIPGYSGEPINTLVGIDPAGKIRGVKIISHAEPIVLIGISEKEIHKFVKQYIGKNIQDRIVIGKLSRQEAISVDAITGATVTAVAENATILEAARRVGIQVGMLPDRENGQREIRRDFTPLSFEELVKQGAFQTFQLMPQELGSEGETPLMDLFFGLLDPPSIGKNLLGEGYYQMATRKFEEEKGVALLYIGSTGELSFKGSGFARGGIFDRFHLEQGGSLFVFKDGDYIHLTGLQGGPRLDEGGVFLVRDERFDPTSPFKLHLTLPYRENGQKRYATFILNYELPARFVNQVLPFWMERWAQLWVGVVISALGLLLATLIFSFRARISRRRGLPDWLRYATLLLSLAFLGGYLKAQPSNTQILTLGNSLFRGRDSLQGLLSEPFLVTFWVFILLGLLLWGRGYFCGWLCPYGALLELTYRVIGRGMPGPFRERRPFLISRKRDRQLARVKYLAFFLILGISFYSLILAEMANEVEPFKVFLLGLKRPWYYLLYLFLTLLASILVYRFFCKTLCPLGGALALLSPVRRVPIKRHPFCANCAICAEECEPLAIQADGRIESRECLQCLNCMTNYYDERKCPALKLKQGR